MTRRHLRPPGRRPAPAPRPSGGLLLLARAIGAYPPPAGGAAGTPARPSAHPPAPPPTQPPASRPEPRPEPPPAPHPEPPSAPPSASRPAPPSGPPPAPRRPAPHVLYVRFHAPRGAQSGGRTDGAPGGVLGEERYGCLLELLGGITPVVQALPPDAALADVRGALRYFGRTPAELAALLRVRALARYDADCVIGVAANPTLARMAAADAPPGTVRTLPAEPEAVAGFLADRPPADLPGIGPATARLLAEYGLDTVGRIAATPLGTLQRLLGAVPGRRLRDRALGLDPVPVVPNASARSVGAERRFDRDELDPARHRRALLSLADDLGCRLRRADQAARALTLTVRYADGASTVRTRRLPEPTGHTPAIAHTAYRMYAGLGLQRARLRAVALRAEDLLPARRAAHQLTFDPQDEKARRIERITDLARERFGPGVVLPAALLWAA